MSIWYTWYKLCQFRHVSSRQVRLNGTVHSVGVCLNSWGTSRPNSIKLSRTVPQKKSPEC